MSNISELNNILNAANIKTNLWDKTLSAKFEANPTDENLKPLLESAGLSLIQTELVIAEFRKKFSQNTSTSTTLFRPTAPDLFPKVVELLEILDPEVGQTFLDAIIYEEKYLTAIAHGTMVSGVYKSILEINIAPRLDRIITSEKISPAIKTMAASVRHVINKYIAREEKDIRHEMLLDGNWWYFNIGLKGKKVENLIRYLTKIHFGVMPADGKVPDDWRKIKMMPILSMKDAGFVETLSGWVPPDEFELTPKVAEAVKAMMHLAKNTDAYKEFLGKNEMDLDGAITLAKGMSGMDRYTGSRELGKDEKIAFIGKAVASGLWHMVSDPTMTLYEFTRGNFDPHTHLSPQQKLYSIFSGDRSLELFDVINTMALPLILFPTLGSFKFVSAVEREEMMAALVRARCPAPILTSSFRPWQIVAESAAGTRMIPKMRYQTLGFSRASRSEMNVLVRDSVTGETKFLRMGTNPSSGLNPQAIESAFRQPRPPKIINEPLPKLVAKDGGLPAPKPEVAKPTQPPSRPKLLPTEAVPANAKPAIVAGPVIEWLSPAILDYIRRQIELFSGTKKDIEKFVNNIGGANETLKKLIADALKRVLEEEELEKQQNEKNQIGEEELNEHPKTSKPKLVATNEPSKPADSNASDAKPTDLDRDDLFADLEALDDLTPAESALKASILRRLYADDLTNAELDELWERATALKNALEKRITEETLAANAKAAKKEMAELEAKLHHPTQVQQTRPVPVPKPTPVPEAPKPATIPKERVHEYLMAIDASITEIGEEVVTTIRQAKEEIEAARNNRETVITLLSSVKTHLAGLKKKMDAVSASTSKIRKEDLDAHDLPINESFLGRIHAYNALMRIASLRILACLEAVDIVLFQQLLEKVLAINVDHPQIMEDLRTVGDAHGIDVFTPSQSAPEFGMKFPDWLSTHLENLITNARTHGNASKVIVSFDSKLGILTLTDNGTGIPADRLKKIGKKNLSDGRSDRGVGLLGFYQAAAAHNSIVYISSKPGETTVRIWLGGPLLVAGFKEDVLRKMGTQRMQPEFSPTSRPGDIIDALSKETWKYFFGRWKGAFNNTAAGYQMVLDFPEDYDIAEHACAVADILESLVPYPEIREAFWNSLSATEKQKLMEVVESMNQLSYGPVGFGTIYQAWSPLWKP